MRNTSRHDVTLSENHSQEGVVGTKRQHVLNEALDLVTDHHARLMDEDSADRKLIRKLLAVGATSAAHDVVARMAQRRRMLEATRGTALALECAMRRPRRALVAEALSLF